MLISKDNHTLILQSFLNYHINPPFCFNVTSGLNKFLSSQAATIILSIIIILIHNFAP